MKMDVFVAGVVDVMVDMFMVGIRVMHVGSILTTWFEFVGQIQLGGAAAWIQMLHTLSSFGTRKFQLGRTT